jgi:hypothetical protein
VLACAGCAGAASASGQADLSAESSSGQAACRPAELKALFRGFQVAGGSLSGAVVLVDAGHDPCWLTGTPPSVTLLNEDGGAVAVRSRPLALPVDAGDVELTPGAQLPGFGAPPERGSAWFTMTWSNWCGDTTPSVQSLLVVLPAGGSVAAPLDTAVPSLVVGPAAPRCDDGRAGSTLMIGRFQAAA